MIDTDKLEALRLQARGKTIAVHVVDLETGESSVRYTDDYVVVTAPGWSVAKTQRWPGTGTVQVVLKPAEPPPA